MRRFHAGLSPAWLLFLLMVDSIRSPGLQDKCWSPGFLFFCLSTLTQFPTLLASLTPNSPILPLESNGLSSAIPLLSSKSSLNHWFSKCGPGPAASHCLKTWKKCKFLGPTLDPLNLTLWRLGPAVYIVRSPPGG